jgi:hypothetical protein
MGSKRPLKCQRPRTEGARTSGAAELFSGRPSAGAMKHQRRRWMQHSGERRVSQVGCGKLVRNPPTAASPQHLAVYCGTSRTTGPLTAGGAATGCSTFCGGLAGLPNCPIGPYAIAITSTIDATIAPNMPATDSEFIPLFPAGLQGINITKTRAVGIVREGPEHYGWPVSTASAMAECPRSRSAASRVPTRTVVGRDSQPLPGQWSLQRRKPNPPMSNCASWHAQQFSGGSAAQY